VNDELRIAPVDGLCGSYAKAGTGSNGPFRRARPEVVQKSASRKWSHDGRESASKKVENY
jgi:hypothetical protein